MKGKVRDPTQMRDDERDTRATLAQVRAAIKIAKDLVCARDGSGTLIVKISVTDVGMLSCVTAFSYQQDPGTGIGETS